VSPNNPTLVGGLELVGTLSQAFPTLAPLAWLVVWMKTKQ
jgi:hypothetical protein